MSDIPDTIYDTLRLERDRQRCTVVSWSSHLENSPCFY